MMIIGCSAKASRNPCAPPEGLESLPRVVCQSAWSTV